jgi:putative membrane-bound dehydrogenase-like protein
MFRVSLLALLVATPAALAQPGTHQMKLNGHTFTLPKDFTIEVAAGADLAPRPIAAAFDERGRLYVTDSSGSNANVKEQLEKKSHRVLRLEDTNGDGKFDKQTVYVKNIMFPEGAMWLAGSLYVAAPPHILKFTDANDDGVAEKEEIWFDGKTLTGCANDLHGPYRGPDGWVYWTKGAFAQQEYTVNGKKFTTRAAHIFRARPDGSRIEPVMTGGMDNPVDVAFTPGGDAIFTTTFFQHPANGRRDGLVHAIHGAVYGKDHDPVYQYPWTHPTLMPPLTHMGPAAPCGLHRYESAEFGKEYANNLFACQFNMRKVSRHVLVPKGATYETKDSDFVVSDNIDFHPTDVIEDADGSLLIIDTGGWYKLCCPTSQLVKPDVTGAIYRVKRVGAHKIDDPRGLKIDWKKLETANLPYTLEDHRPAVRQRAADELASRGVKAVPVLRKLLLADPNADSPAFRASAIWAVCRIDSPQARALVRELVEAPDGAPILTEGKEDVRRVAIHAAGYWRDKEAVPNLIAQLDSKNLHTRRAAAAALGRIGDPKTVPAILSALEHKDMDRALDHALTFALIEIGDAKRTAAGLESKQPRVRRACLAALENITDSNLNAKVVLAELDSPDAALRETAWWVAGRHPQWGDQLAGYFTDKLANLKKLAPAERDQLTDRLAKFAKSEAVQKVIGKVAFDTHKDGTDPLVLRAMARSGVKSLPESWHGGLLAAMISQDEALVREALAVLRAIPVKPDEFTGITATARKLGEGGFGKPWSEELIFTMLASVPPGALPLSDVDFRVGVKMLDRREPVRERAAAAEAISRAKLTTDQLAALAAALKTVNALELPKLLAVFEKSKDEKVGLALVAALREKGVRSAVRVEMVKPILDKYPKAVKDEAEKLYAELAEARKDERAKLEKIIAELKPGDVRRGQLVFNNAKAQCIACHKVGYVGGTVGPDLTRIGGIRTERDLLESIVFPSASFVRSYESVRVVTTDERTFNGVLKKDAPDEIIVVVAADKEERIARADVASITPSSVSLMPSGLDQQLTPQDLADLVAFLRACK